MRLRFLAALVTVVAIANAAYAQIDLTSGSSLTINFDTGSAYGLPNSGGASLPSAITAATTNTPNITTVNAGIGSTTDAGLYGFGSASGATLADRALGFYASNGFTGPSGTGIGYLGIRFRNSGAAPVTSVAVTYDGETWRQNGNANAHSLQFSYAVNPTNITTGTYTTVAGLQYTYTPPNTATLGGGSTPVSSQTGITSTFTLSTPLAQNDTLLIRWSDLNDTGNDHSLAIDNVNVSFQPVPAPPAAISLGIGGLVGLAGAGLRNMRLRAAKRKAKTAA